MRYAVLPVLLLAACAGVPEYPSPYSAPAAGYGAAPVAPLSARCTPYYQTAVPPPAGVYPCPMPLSPPYPYPGYGSYFYRAPYFGAAYVRRPIGHTPRHTHSGRRGKK